MKEEVIRAKGGRDNQARRVALYFAQRYTELGNEAIGAVFGGIHFSTVSKASARLREEMVSDKKLLELINDLDSNFKA